MAAGKFNDIIEKKATYRRSFQLFRSFVEIGSDDNVPVDLSGLSSSDVLCKLRKKLTDTSALISFTTSIVDPANGIIEISLTAAQTSSLNFDNAAWDLFVVWSPSETEKFLEGNMTLIKAAS